MTTTRRGGTPDDARLADMAPERRFQDRAGDYVQHRPDYPAAAIDHVLEDLGDAARLVAADVGAGTGISSRQLAERGVRVIAIEPNAGMREAAEPHPRVTSREGSAEATSLDKASVDLVLCAQAFHWFRQREAALEFHRVLRPGGRLALLWNTRSRTDPFTLGYIDAIHAVNGEHPAESIEFDAANLGGAGVFSPLELRTFDHEQRLDLEGLIGRAASASYVSKEPEPFARLVSLLEALFDRHRDVEGRVTLRYVTEVWRATAVEPAAHAIPIEAHLDLHPFQPREILDVVRDYLDEAKARGFREVRLIHGRGIGFQRERIRELLATHPDVIAFEDAPPGRGHWGATVVKLRG